MRNLVRRLVFIAGAGVVVLFGVWLFQSPPVPVDMVQAMRAPMRVVIEEEGRARIRDVYQVSAPVAGTLLRSRHEAGDEVKAGESVVATIEPVAPSFLDARAREESAAAMAAAQASARLAEAELEFAMKELERAEKLIRTQSIAERNYEQAVLEVEVRRAQLALRQSALKSARAHLQVGPESKQGQVRDLEACCIKLHAPADGKILQVHHRDEQTIASGTVILEIGNPDDLEIVAELLSRDAAHLALGASAEITWGTSNRTSATLKRIEPAAFTRISALGIEEQRVNAILDLSGDPQQFAGLGHEYRIYAYITLWEGQDVLQVPLGALLRKGSAWALFRVENGVARLTPVEIGQRNAQMAEVLDGLEEGAQIITHPGDRVYDGVEVIQR